MGYAGNATTQQHTSDTAVAARASADGRTVMHGRCRALPPETCAPLAMAALASRTVVKATCAPRPSVRPAAAAKPRGPRALCAVELDGDTITLGLAALAGVGFGIGLPVLFTVAEKRDRERIEEIRELNRATLKATGATLSEARPSRRATRQPSVHRTPAHVASSRARAAANARAARTAPSRCPFTAHATRF